MLQLNSEIVECRAFFVIRKFVSLLIGSLGIEVIAVIEFLPEQWRPPNSPPGSPVGLIIMGVVALTVSVWAWHWLDIGAVQAGPDGIRFGRSEPIKWDEVATCSIHNFTAPLTPNGVAFVLEDKDGKRLFSFNSGFYLPGEAQRLVKYVRVKLADKVIIQANH